MVGRTLVALALTSSVAFAQTTTADPAERVVQRRAIEAINWGMRAVQS
jgi:hypothetical protein